MLKKNNVYKYATNNVYKYCNIIKINDWAISEIRLLTHNTKQKLMSAAIINAY